MLYFRSIGEAENVFKALSAPMRLRLMELVYRDSALSMNEIAETLGITNGAVSIHVAKLEEAGLVRVEAASGKHGTMKLVRPRHDRLVIDLAPEAESRPCYSDDIRIGYYTASSVVPLCGIATGASVIGSLDNPKAFSFPERFNAGILWFSSGYIEYNLPNHLQAGEKLNELQISFEISSCAPNAGEDFPSDIYFSINGIMLGKWVCPGNYGGRRGYISPEWWEDASKQYGLLKTLIINNDGVFIDGTSRLSEVTLKSLGIDYNSYITFRIEVPQNTANCGGCVLFGEEFGDHNQAIRIKAYY